MSNESLTNLDDDPRLTEIIEVVVAIARNEFDKRARVGDGTHLVDGLAAGLNMLAEEVSQRDTREKAYQQHLLQNERLIAVGQLAAGVAHELNNPAAFVLTNLTALTQLIDQVDQLIAADGKPSSKTESRKLLDTARKLTRDNVAGVERIVAIVRELRSFSRRERGVLELLSLSEVIDNACTLVRAEISYNAVLRVTVDPSLRVRGDKTKLEQVVTNLLLNAAQAIPEGVTVANEITVRTFERDEWAVIEVRDTGVGLSEEAQKRMFEPFFTTKPRGRGTGLGLAISADIVRHHGGALQMIETSPAGTAFEVLLPRVGGMMHGGELVSRPPAEDDGHPPVATSQRRRSRVLLIDDEQMLLDAYSRFFDDVYEIETALGGRRAIEHLSVDSAWDAILCDVMMPVVDGVAVYEWVTANRPALAERMLFCTGGAFTPRSMAFTERHAWRVLEKPIALGELRTALDAIAAGELL